uniref:Si:dkey-211f22.5 n=1 Tax=Poecilia formosa TaxID=48698 RepID=A0A087X593_POEFO
VSYERILAIENLNDVPNPWKGFTMNRCLVVALVVLLVSSGVNEVHEALDYFVEETGIGYLVDCLQTGTLPQFSIWDSVTSWWGSEEVGAIRRRKKPIGRKVILKPKANE